MFLRVVVELRCLRIGCLAGPVDRCKLVEAIAIELLRDVCGTEDVRIVAVAALLTTILCAGFPQGADAAGETGVVREVEVASPVFVGVVLEAALHVLGHGLEDVLAGRPQETVHTVGSLNGVGEREVCAVGVFFLGLREDAGPVDGEAWREVVCAFEMCGKHALGLRERTCLVVLGIGVGAYILGVYGVVVTHALRVGAHIHVVPLKLVVVKLQVDLGVKARREVMDRIVAVLKRVDVHGLFARCHLHRVVGALGTAENVLHAAGKHHADAVFPEAVADGEASNKVGGWKRVLGYLCRAVAEIGCRGFIVGTVSLVGRGVGVAAAVGREIVAAVVPEIVAGTYGGVGLNLEMRRRILHDHVDHTTGGIALHVGGQRLRHHEAVHKVGGKHVEGYVTVLVVGARYLDAVDERVVVAFVHASQYGIGSLPRRIALHGHARHTLQHTRHVDIGRELYALLTHDVEHVARRLLHVDGAAVGMIFLMAFNHHLAQLVKVFVEGYGDGTLVGNLDGHLACFVRDVTHNERVASLVGQLAKFERAVETCCCLDVGQLLHLYHRADERLTRAVVLDNAVDGVGRDHCRGGNESCAD